MKLFWGEERALKLEGSCYLTVIPPHPCYTVKISTAVNPGITLHITMVGYGFVTHLCFEFRIYLMILPAKVLAYSAVFGMNTPKGFPCQSCLKCKASWGSSLVTDTLNVQIYSNCIIHLGCIEYALLWLAQNQHKWFFDMATQWSFVRGQNSA